MVDGVGDRATRTLWSLHSFRQDRSVAEPLQPGDFPMTGTPGRPLSAELSEQLLSVAVDILAQEGWSRLNSDRIAARARAGKAGIYRRWPSMSALARHAVGGFTL